MANRSVEAMLVTLLTTAGCAGGSGVPRPAPLVGSGNARDTVAEGHLTVPGTYVMKSRCVGAPGRDLSLTLTSDSLFLLRQTYRDEACQEEISILYMGRWSLSDDRRVLLLTGEFPSLRRFDIVNAQTIRMAENLSSRTAGADRQEGRTVRLVPFRTPFRLRGLMSPITTAGS
jgi:hypothetical protein